MEVIELFGLAFSQVPLSEAIEALGKRAGEKKGLLVFTPNVDHLVLIETDSSYRNVYQEADWVFADGMPIVWFSRLVGRPLPERVTGADLVPGLCRIAAEKGLRVFILGGAPDVTPLAAERLFKMNPRLEIAGIATPPQGFENDDAINLSIIDVIKRASPDILFVALGAPRQEIWACQNRDRLNAGIILGVGGAFDFISGRTKRAPAWMQKLGLEWLWRLVREPKRLWKRYLVRDMRFIGIAYREWRKQRSGRLGTT